jgi:NitT/TauT family transport system permease protein
MRNFSREFILKSKYAIYPNRWDILAIFMLFIFFAIVAFAAKGLSAPYQLGVPIPISLDPSHLPWYALRTVIRMFIALICSLLFTLIIGTLAAKNRHAGRVIIPFIDVMQSVPVLALLAITVTGFIALFPGSLLGPECAAIFVIFTAQVWNITLSFYQSLKTVPEDLKETAKVFQLSPWQRFWRIEVPFSMPGLLWNMMLSMSGSWFFVVASEAISVANQQISLPGVGSYIALAIKQANLYAVGYAITTMFLVILLYDQLIFRPLNYWAEKFKMDLDLLNDQKIPRPWLTRVLQKTHVLKYASHLFDRFLDHFVNPKSPLMRGSWLHREGHSQWAVWFSWLWYTAIMCGLTIGMIVFSRFIIDYVTTSEILHVMFLGFITAIRVVSVVVLCSLVWVPIGVWIGLRPKATQIIQPIAQFLAAFPSYLLFPLVVTVIIHYALNVEVWTAPLMVLGTQWYILFNVIVGASTLPKDFYQVADNFGLKGWLWWKRLILPGIFPYYITGAITATGGAWNTSIVAEYVSWGSTTLKVTGIGAYITENTMSGDFPRVALAIGVMCIFVLLFNHLIWRPLFLFAQARFSL